MYTVVKKQPSRFCRQDLVMARMCQNALDVGLCIAEASEASTPSASSIQRYNVPIMGRHHSPECQILHSHHPHQLSGLPPLLGDVQRHNI